MNRFTAPEENAKTAHPRKMLGRWAENVKLFSGGPQVAAIAWPGLRYSEAPASLATASLFPREDLIRLPVEQITFNE